MEYVTNDGVGVFNKTSNDIGDVYQKKNTIELLSYFILSGLGIPGNVMTMVVLLSSAKLRKKPINVILIHQSCIDMIVCMLVITEELLDTSDDTIIPVICHLFLSRITSGITLLTSSFNMTLLSIERQFAIVNPLQYDPWKVLKRLPYIFVAEWLFCIGALTVLPSYTTIKDGVCLVGVLMFSTPLWNIYPSYELTLAIVIPLIITTICYSRMFYALHQSTKMSKCDSGILQSSGANIHKLRLAQINIFKTCFSMLVVFLVCWTTMESAVVLFICNIYTSLSNLHYTIGRLAVILNSCLNPYIYAIRYDDFRQQVLILINREESRKHT